jgi:GTP pyrophosphokinase
VIDLEASVARLRSQLEERGLAPAVERTERVLRAAWRAHDGQNRKNGDPYIVHPIRVAEVVLVEWDRREPDLVAAALLHDAVEDTPLRLEEIEDLAGAHVRELVFLLTKPDPAGFPSKAERDRVYFARLHDGPEGASVVKCADRVDNLRDMLSSGWSLEKKRAYLVEAREEILPGARERAPEAARALEAVIEEIARQVC